MRRGPQCASTGCRARRKRDRSRSTSAGSLLRGARPDQGRAVGKECLPHALLLPVARRGRSDSCLLQGEAWREAFLQRFMHVPMQAHLRACARFMRYASVTAQCRIASSCTSA